MSKPDRCVEVRFTFLIVAHQKTSGQEGLEDRAPGKGHLTAVGMPRKRQRDLLLGGGVESNGPVAKQDRRWDVIGFVVQSLLDRFLVERFAIAKKPGWTIRTSEPE